MSEQIEIKYSCDGAYVKWFSEFKDQCPTREEWFQWCMKEILALMEPAFEVKDAQKTD